MIVMKVMNGDDQDDIAIDGYVTMAKFDTYTVLDHESRTSFLWLTYNMSILSSCLSF